LLLRSAFLRIPRPRLDNIRSHDKTLQSRAFLTLIEATDKPVDWAYKIWDEMLAGLSHKDNHVRAISAQVLCNLAKSDPKNRMLKDFAALLAVTKDERFVTARHTLIRYDICQSLHNVYNVYNVAQDTVKDEKIRETVLTLIETEDDLKYRKKYMSLWRAK
jgi:hypothetical protein